MPLQSEKVYCGSSDTGRVDSSAKNLLTVRIILGRLDEFFGFHQNQLMIPILMSGGSGTRLWPLSRTKWPKQFCRLFDESLQGKTLKRLALFGRPWIVTSRLLKDLTTLNLGESGVQGGEILLEPRGRNTAAAIAFVCRVLELQGKSNEVVGIFPADHLVTKEKDFLSALKVAEHFAQSRKVVTLGIRPQHPETGFGYIQTDGPALFAENGIEAFEVSRFHEKPDLEKAKAFVADDRFSWNAGIFVFQVSHMIQLLETHEPAVWNPFRELAPDLSNLVSVYDEVKSTSIDYAVMEKMGGTGDLICLPVEIGWSDVGSWDAVAEESGASASGVEQNYLIESPGSFISKIGSKVVALIGVPDLRVVDTPDALLISAAGESQKVRQVVEQLALQKDPVLDRHLEEIFIGGRVQGLHATKDSRTEFYSLNKGQVWTSPASVPRHWIVTRGAGEMLLNGVPRSLSRGEHVHLKGEDHPQVRNASKEPLEWIEVQLSSSKA